MTNVSESDRRESMRAALRAYADKHGREAAHGLVQRVAGVQSVSKVPSDKIGAVIGATNAFQKPGPHGTIAEMDAGADKLVPGEGDTVASLQPGAMARWNKRRPGD